jgi:hypothetical protein
MCTISDIRGFFPMALTTPQNPTRIAQNDIASAVSKWMRGKPLTNKEALIVAYATVLNRAELLDRLVSSYDEGGVQ